MLRLILRTPTLHLHLCRRAHAPVALLLVACAARDPMEEVPDDGATSDTSGATATADTSTGGALPMDCSCYDPRVDVPFEGTELEDACLGAAAALPGCVDEAPPCASIDRFYGEENVPATAGPPEAVACLAERLASGERPPFRVEIDRLQGADDVDYVPLGDGRYATYTCGFFDNPPAHQGVATVTVADADYFAACISADPDPAALFACIEAGLTEVAEGGMPACP